MTLQNFAKNKNKKNPTIIHTKNNHHTQKKASF